MQLLILGGTAFLGRHLAEAAVADGHDVTTFTRGKTGTTPEGVEALHGDRDGDLGALEGRRWDVVVDTSGYVPRVVEQSAALLRDAAESYVFVSSASVYADHHLRRGTEDRAVEPLPADHGDDIAKHYGGLKADAERTVREHFGNRALIVRAGLLVGPLDRTGRATWWVERVARGGEVLAPAPAGQPVQMIDARDLASWMLDAAQRRLSGTFNATGMPTTFGAFLEACVAATGADAHPTWVDEPFLLERGVEPWSELPLWLATVANPGVAGFFDLDVSRAIGEGLGFRPLVETLRDTHMWARTGDAAAALPPTMGGRAPGLAPELEAALLAEWHDERGRPPAVSAGASSRARAR